MDLENKNIILTGSVEGMEEIRAALTKKGASAIAFLEKEKCHAHVKNAEEIDALMILDAYEAVGGADDEEALWNEIMDRYVRQNYLLAMEAAQKMRAGGNILFLYSSEAFVRTGNYADAYVIAAGTERAMINVLAQRLGKAGIAVKGIAMAQKGEEDALHFPLGKGSGPEALGETLAFLCSEDAAYISGNTILMDGGNHLAYRRYQIGK